MKIKSRKRRKTAQSPLKVNGLTKKHREDKPLTGQERQDEIFRKMSAERRVEIGAKLWLLAKSLAGDKINYGTKRS